MAKTLTGTQSSHESAAKRTNKQYLQQKKNPKEECKVVMTRSRMATHVDEGKAEKKMEEHKQQLAAKPTLEPVDDFVELEEVNKEAEGEKGKKTPIKEKEKEIKEKEKS